METYIIIHTYTNTHYRCHNIHIFLIFITTLIYIHGSYTSDIRTTLTHRHTTQWTNSVVPFTVTAWTHDYNYRVIKSPQWWWLMITLYATPWTHSVAPFTVTMDPWLPQWWLTLCVCVCVCVCARVRACVCVQCTQLHARVHVMCVCAFDTHLRTLYKMRWIWTFLSLVLSSNNQWAYVGQ